MGRNVTAMPNTATTLVIGRWRGRPGPRLRLTVDLERAPTEPAALGADPPVQPPHRVQVHDILTQTEVALPSLDLIMFLSER